MPDISEREIQIFVDAVGHYFSQVAGEKAEVQAAYLAQGELLPPAYDFTGLINVSGKYEGCIYFSAPRTMLARLLLAMQEPRQHDTHLLDAVGEIANTLAGNARQYFGESMQISVPVTMQGAVERQQVTRARPYVILVKWKRYEASLVVDILRK